LEGENDMKRFASLMVLFVLLLTGNGLAEMKTHTYNCLYETYGFGTSNVLNAVTYKITTDENKQPLLFQADKTDFSYMKLREIVQLPDEVEIALYAVGKSEEKFTFPNKLKDYFLSLERIFENKKAGETWNRTIRIKDFYFMNSEDYKVKSNINGEWNEQLGLEQLGSMLIEYFAQNIIVIHVQGTSLEKITALYNGSTPDSKNLYWVTDKSEAKTEADKAYIRETLLGTTEEELPEVLKFLQKQVSGYIYQDINTGEYFVRTTTPSEDLRALW
jgi:hypothetical protein